MKWVTWVNIGVDRMACGWLIRRFIDPEAEFAFVTPDQRPLPDGFEPFDIPGARLSHRRGHCTFHTMLKEFRLKDPVLDRMARIIDEADTIQEALLEPAAGGLDLICRGIRLLSPDDHAALEKSALVYEAVYAQISAEYHANGGRVQKPK